MFHKAAQKQDREEEKQTKQQGKQPMSSSENTQETKTDNNAQQRGVEIPQASNTGNANYAPRPAQGLPGQFPSAGASQQSSAPATPTPMSNNAAGRRLVIGSGITMSGEIEACDHLVVEGTVEAALKGANVLDVAETGVFYGKVEIGEATIAGRFEGEITVKGRLTVESSGIIKGAITYDELAVEAGAKLEGTLKPYQAVTELPTAEATETKSTSKKSSKKEAANAGSELPFADKTATAAE